MTSKALVERAAAQKAAAEAAIEAMEGESPINSQSVTIGGRDFVVGEVPALNLFLVGNLFIEKFEEIEKAGILDWDWDNFSVKNLGALIGKMALVWDKIPEVMGRLMALLLNLQDPEEIAHVQATITVLEGLEVFDYWLDYNRYEDVMERFFRLRQRLGGAVARAKARAQGEASRTS